MSQPTHTHNLQVKSNGIDKSSKSRASRGRGDAGVEQTRAHKYTSP